MVATQHGFGLLLLDTGATQRKGEFVTAAHGQDGVKQAGGWKNVHSGDTKIRPQGLVDGLHDNLRMTNKVRAVLVHPRVKGGHIHVAYFLALPSHSMQGRRACSPPPPPPPQKKASQGSRGGTGRLVVYQTVPLTLAMVMHLAMRLKPA